MKIVPGNSVVRDMVVRGEVKAGLTDTDDVNVAFEDKQPVAMVFPDREGMGVPIMPNMTSLIASAPHPEAGKRLIDYLLSADVERMVAESGAVQIPLHGGTHRIDEILQLTRIDRFKQAYPGRLSGGEQQRVALCARLSYPHIFSYLMNPCPASMLI